MSERCTWGTASEEEEMLPSFLFLRYMQGKHLLIIKTRSRKVLFSLVEISAILGFGFKRTIPLKLIFQLIIETLCLK